MPAFHIGRHPFKTKQAATLRVRQILHAAALNEPLTGAEGDLIASLYSLHPRREGEPTHFQVGLNDYHGSLTRGFHAILPDGGIVRWSYLPCLSPQTDAPSVTRAARAALALSQREALRAAYQGRAIIPCHFCRAGVTLEKAHVHHMPPKFRDILDAFISLIGLPEIVTAALGDDFLHPSLKRRWILFHDSVAQRVVLCAECNIKDERAAK